MVETQAATEEAATIRKATLADVPRISEVLAGAFYDDPPFTWVLHGAPRRMNTLKRGFELSLRRIWMEQDVTYTTGGVVAAAVWELPDHWRVGVAQQLRLLPAFSRIFGRHVPRALRPARSDETRLKSPRGAPLLPPVHRRRAGVARPRSRRRGDGTHPRALRPRAHAGLPRRHNPPQPGALRAARLRNHRRVHPWQGRPAAMAHVARARRGLTHPQTSPAGPQIHVKHQPPSEPEPPRVAWRSERLRAVPIATETGTGHHRRDGRPPSGHLHGQRAQEQRKPGQPCPVAEPGRREPSEERAGIVDHRGPAL